jgi:nitronate monooxygenase
MVKEMQPLNINGRESRLPIIGGAMSVGLTTAEFAAGMANEGCIGTIGGVALGISPEIKNKEDYLKTNELILRQVIIDALRMSNDGNIGVNLMVPAIDYENSVKIAVESGVKYIMSGAGLPLYLPDYVKQYKVDGQKTPALIPIVSSVKAAGLILKKWVRDGVLPGAFIVETPNTAGGHLGAHVEDIGKEEFRLETVVPNLVDFLKDKVALSDLLNNDGLVKFVMDNKIPIIAAGGIWNRSDIDRMLELGASGVQMSTRFLTTDEISASKQFKDWHLNNDPKKNPIRVIKSPVGMPGRAIENDFIRNVSAGKRFDLGPCVGCLKGCGYLKDKTNGYCIVRALDNARRGNKNGVLFTGTNGYLLKEDRDAGIHTISQIIKELTG